MTEQHQVHVGPTPVNRATSAGIGTMLATVVMWALEAFAGVVPTPTAAAAIAGLIMAACSWAYSRYGGIG